jgi:topoisomerase IV subunit A
MAYLHDLFDSYWLEYASYYIKERAIPHIDDGLKPVQRRILHALQRIDDGRFHKVANVVGQTMQFHPHGDQSIYGALVNLANKDLFIERQGNFGNIHTGDVAAAARYIECRLTPLAREVLFNKETTRFIDSYDGRNQEPVVLPAKIPVLLAQGAEGIAVGMATKILPHNLVELWQAQINYLRGKPFALYPDFPTAGLADFSSYGDGNGKVLVRARLEVPDPTHIVIREIPFGTTTEQLIVSVEAAAREKKIVIKKITDYTSDQVKIEITLPNDVLAGGVIDTLYAFTDCEVSIAPNLVVINSENVPEVVSVSSIVKSNTDRLSDLLQAELEIERGHHYDRLHARTLEQIFIENRVYKVIENKRKADDIVRAVHKGLAPLVADLIRDVTDDDVDTLLKIPIRRISLYDINRAKKEMREIQQRLAAIEKSLGDMTKETIRFIKGLIANYGDNFPRRTEIESFNRTDKREVAKRDLQLRFDKKTGYVGHKVNGAVLDDISPFDRVLVVRSDGSYTVSEAPDKLYAGRDMLHCGLVDTEQVFNLVYTDPFQYTFIKRFVIGAYILNRPYQLVPEHCHVEGFTTDGHAQIHLSYLPKPRLRILEEVFLIADYPIRNVKASGIRLSTKELANCTVEFAK